MNSEESVPWRLQWAYGVNGKPSEQWRSSPA